MNCRHAFTSCLLSISFLLILVPHLGPGQTLSVEADIHPSRGLGPFELRLRVTNTSAETVTTDLWIERVSPDGDSRVVMVKTGLVLEPFGSIGRRWEQGMGEGSEPGEHVFVINAGTYPDVVLGNDSTEYTMGPEEKMTASDGTASDEFGWSVSMSGDYAVIGAYRDDDSGPNSGSAYVFHREGSAWVEEAKLSESDGAAYNEFGWSVSMCGDYAVIGARGDDDNGPGSGSAYIFRREGSAWIEGAKLTASDGGGNFGGSVSISGDHTVIGAKHDDDKGYSSGSAYVFRREGSMWVEEAKLTASDGAASDEFGWSVSISGVYAVVGAIYDDDKGFNSGSAYIFRREGSAWVEETKLTASDGDAIEYFGTSVSISGDYAVIGAVLDGYNGFATGSAYVFRREGSAWIEEAKLTATDGAAYDYFGQSVSISGDYAVIGAIYGGDGYALGSAYVFHREGSVWIEEAKMTASDGAEEDRFGQSVSISGDYAVIGAYQDDDLGTDSGSAYVFSGIRFPGNHPMAGPEAPQEIQLRQEDVTGAGTGTADAFSLSQNHPNPFNPSTEITYTVPVPSRVRLEVFNTLGQRVSLLVDGVEEPGYHSAHWNGTIASGIYFYRLEATALDNPANHFAEVKKMIYLR